jgi:hypothetical protein
MPETKDLSTGTIGRRQKAIEFAISEIAAYKNSVYASSSTQNLISSAAAIARYIETGEVTTQ